MLVTGKRCRWVEPDLCSACDPTMDDPPTLDAAYVRIYAEAMADMNKRPLPRVGAPLAVMHGMLRWLAGFDCGLSDYDPKRPPCVESAERWCLPCSAHVILGKGVPRFKAMAKMHRDFMRTLAGRAKPGPREEI